MSLFRYNDLEIRYSLHGNTGPLLICLHGFGSGPSDFQELVPFLEPRFRVLLVNLKTFFSHIQPISFRSQTQALAAMAIQLLADLKPSGLSLLGQSFGGTLSYALRLELAKKGKLTDKHILLNPMPFFPLDKVMHQRLKTVVGFGYMPGGVDQFTTTEVGRKSLVEVAKIFRIGAFGHHDVRHFNRRKLQLVEKALRRFQWIDQNENWDHWQQQVPKDDTETHLFFSTHDPLFSRHQYQDFVKNIPDVALHAVPHAGHLLLQDLSDELRQNLVELIS